MKWKERRIFGLQERMWYWPQREVEVVEAAVFGDLPDGRNEKEG